jgi:hypothetical protein
MSTVITHRTATVSPTSRQRVASPGSPRRDHPRARRARRRLASSRRERA